MPFATGTVTASGDNQLIAAPTDPTQHIVIHEMSIENEAATANTVILKNGATPFWRQLLQTQGAAVIHYPVGQPQPSWELGPGQAFNLNLSAATLIGFSISYSIR